MRILIRTSKWAIWSRRFGSLAIPVLVLPVYLHREQIISSDDFHRIEAVALALALMGLMLGFGAFIRIWQSGDRGWGKATLGVLSSLLCLAPVGIAAYAAQVFPPVNEVSTDWIDPPALIVAQPGPPPDAALYEKVATAFPNARTRSYLVDGQVLFELARAEVADQGWTIKAEQRPTGPDGTGTINALAVTLLGWRDEVAIRVSGDTEGASIAMRSASLSGPHDLGANGLRIEGFMLRLDKAVTARARANPAIDPDETAPVAVDEEATDG